MARSTSQQWAPWYAYVIPIVGLNLIKQQFMDGVPALVNIGTTVLMAGALFLLITWAWRSTHRDDPDS